MKYARLPIALFAASLVLASCKSPDPEFGIPDEPSPGLFSRFDGPPESWSEKRYRWKVNERAKSRAMFDRMKDEN